MKNTPNQAAEQALVRAFPAALVLTGSMGGAELAVENAIDRLTPDFTAEELLLETVRFAVQLPKWQDDARPILPQELQALSFLCSKARNIFVLRFLLGFSSEACSEILGETRDDVDEALYQSLANAARVLRNPLRRPEGNHGTSN